MLIFYCSVLGLLSLLFATLPSAASLYFPPSGKQCFFSLFPNMLLDEEIILTESKSNDMHY